MVLECGAGGCSGIITASRTASSTSRLDGLFSLSSPISVCDWDGNDGSRVIYKAVGRGTEAHERPTKPGRQPRYALSALGNGFDASASRDSDRSSSEAASGVPPLYGLCRDAAGSG